MIVSDLRDRNRQVAYEEGQEDCKYHLRDSPLVSACFSLSVVFYRGSLIVAVKVPRTHMLGSLMFTHALL